MSSYILFICLFLEWIDRSFDGKIQSGHSFIIVIGVVVLFLFLFSKKQTNAHTQKKKYLYTHKVFTKEEEEEEESDQADLIWYEIVEKKKFYLSYP
jgi:hypothetical protein